MTKLTKPEIAQHIAADLVAHLDEWYSQPETFDDELDRQIHRWYADAPKVFPKFPYFSPSSSDACPRELYYRVRKAKRDESKRQPHTGRWAEIGTAVGDMIQRTVLAMERSYEKKTGNPCKFRFERNDDGTPVFEDFAKRNKKVEHEGQTYYLFGTTDGIMTYVSPAGRKMRVGLEIKSKQTTPARTSDFTMREPEKKHVKQCVAYSHMYDVDYFVILYVNTAHKGWSMSEEEYAKNPDIRAFGIYIDEVDRRELFDYFTDVLYSVDAGEPLPLDVNRWTFNSFKDAIIADLTDEEFAEIERYAMVVENSSAKAFDKKNVRQAFDDIRTRYLAQKGVAEDAVH